MISCKSFDLSWFVLFFFFQQKPLNHQDMSCQVEKPLLSFEIHAPSIIELVIKSFYWDLQLNFIGNEFGVFQARMKFYVTFNFLFQSKVVQVKVLKFSKTSNVTFVLKRNIKGKCMSKYFCYFQDKHLFLLNRLATFYLECVMKLVRNHSFSFIP